MIKGRKFTVSQFFTFAILGLVFLISIDAFNRNQIFLYALFFIFFFTPNRKMKFDFNVLLLLIFSMCLIVFNDTFNNSIFDMVSAFNYPLCYMVGKNIFRHDMKIDIERMENNVKKVIYIFSIGTFLHYVLNMIVNINKADRVVIEFWSGKILSATAQAAFSFLIIGVIAATLFSNVRKKIKLLAIVSLLMVVAYNLILSGRTIFVFILISIVFAYFYKSYLTKTNILKTVAIFAIMTTAIILLYKFDVFSIKTVVENSNFYDRFFTGEYTQDINEDSRLEHKMYYILHLGDSMLGGGHLRALYGHSAHDLYLDTYDESSVFAFLAIVTYIAISLVRLVKCLKRKTITVDTKLLVSTVYLILNVAFCMEPIIRGMPWLLYSYCFIDGALSQLLEKIKSADERDL